MKLDHAPPHDPLWALHHAHNALLARVEALEARLQPPVSHLIDLTSPNDPCLRTPTAQAPRLGMHTLAGDTVDPPAPEK